MTMPAVRAGFIPRPWPMVIKAMPTVAVAVQDEPQARPTMAQSMVPAGRKVFGDKNLRP